jgi:hypothetical protein
VGIPQVMEPDLATKRCLSRIRRTLEKKCKRCERDARRRFDHRAADIAALAGAFHLVRARGSCQFQWLADVAFGLGEQVPLQRPPSISQAMLV